MYSKYKLSCTLTFLWIFCVVLSQGCTSKTLSTTKQTKMNIIGTWIKNTDTDCAAKYPEKLKFNQNGFFEAEASPNSLLHPIWDVGKYEIENDSIKMATSYGARIYYSIRLETDIITFKDTEGCTFIYEKVK